MPVRNEAAFIGRSVGSVLAQDYPRDRMEILVADGSSQDGTAEAVGGLAELLRRLQTGSVRAYAASLLFGAVLVFGYYLWR